MLKQIIAILIYSDNIPIIHEIVNSDLSSFRDDKQQLTIKKLLEYYQNYNNTPKELHAKEILNTLFSEEYKEIFKELNEDYVIEKLRKQIIYNKYSNVLLEVLSMLQKGPDNVDNIEYLVQKLSKVACTATIDSVQVSQEICSNSLQKGRERELLSSGIKSLDDIQFVPEKGTLGVLMGKPKSGKSLYLLQMAIKNIIGGKKVLLITLEVSTNTVLQRLCRTVFNVCDKKVPYETFSIASQKVIPVVPDRLLSDITKEDLEDMNRFNNLYIVERPQRSFSIQNFETLLNSFIVKGFHPDLVLIDYVAIMDYGRGNRRDYEVLPPLFGTLRGLASKYHVAIETVHQPSADTDTDDQRLLSSNRVSLAKGIVNEVDRFMTWTATLTEQAIGVGRLFPEMNRDGEGGRYVFLNQIDYKTSTFSVDSCLFTKTLYSIIFGKKQ